jgi:hypothetical protein
MGGVKTAVGLSDQDLADSLKTKFAQALINPVRRCAQLLADLPGDVTPTQLARFC